MSLRSSIQPDRGSEAYISELEARLLEAEETLEAIRTGAVDAVIVGRSDDQRVYTIENADRPYRVLIEQMQEGAVTLTEDGTILYCNVRFAELVGASLEKTIGSSFFQYVPDHDRAAADLLLERSATGGGKGEYSLRHSDGELIPVYLSFIDLPDEDKRVLCGIVTDLTEQKLRNLELSEVNRQLSSEIAERAKAEDQLRQSQKMEAVGQLTGGLAHDFNNLLAGISGSLELMQRRIQQGRISDIDRYMVAAQGAAKRAAALTHRLLAFSRRQTLDPKPTNVNRLISDMQDLIQRTVGPSVSLAIMTATDVWNALVDPSQLENALLNLCINARDAMPNGGRIVIETSNKSLDEFGSAHYEMPKGSYLALSVTDNGEGMTADVMSRVFEPFFTTKPIGEGTGLGLSMIYGFAKQSGGQVRIDSSVGQGTTVSIYLPRYFGSAEENDVDATNADLARAVTGETVLVVDDEPTVRMLIVELLNELGYTAIEANDSNAGLQILKSDVRIDLLVTDIGLPGGMNGRQMVDSARSDRPHLKVLFITGYAESAVLGSSQLSRETQVMTKPFAVDAMAARIRTMIEMDKVERD